MGEELRGREVVRGRERRLVVKGEGRKRRFLISRDYKWAS